MTFPEITGYEIDTLDGPVVYISAHANSGMPDRVLFLAEQYDDADVILLNLTRDDARLLARYLIKMADVIDARKAKEKEA